MKKLNLGNVVVTGGLGFIGSHFVRHIINGSRDRATYVINIDYQGYGSNLDNVGDLKSDPRYTHINANISNLDELDALIATAGKINTMVNFAAETHVDRSIANPKEFVESNTNGVLSLLEFCRLHDVEKYIQISTDEVYGDATNQGQLNEDFILRPNSPYSASKASGDLLARSYHETYGINTIITRCSNNFGPNQFPEKLIPKTIIRALMGLSIPIYGDGKQSREWLYVIDHVKAILQIISRGKSGEIYNISSSNEISNIDLANKIGSILNKFVGIKIKIEHVSDRPGHDKRYSLDWSKLKDQIGWCPEYSFDAALEETIKWYLKNDWWWKPLVNESVLHHQPWTLNWKR